MTAGSLRLAIVSDLHIGDSAREFDMRPDGVPPYPNYPGYLDYFQKALEEHSISADVLIVSGDITNRAQPSQFQHAAKVIRKLAEMLAVPENQVLLVPGNHDLNWDIAKLAQTAGEPFWLDFCFAPYRDGSDKAGCVGSAAHSLINPPHFFLHEHDNADIWCFNSAAYDLPDQKPHRGEIREVHRVELAERFGDRYNGKEKDRYRVFMTHHHPKAQPELYPDIPDFSGMVNGESLLDLLMTFDFDLVLHGHKHRPWCRTFLETGKSPIVVWCSGSFAHTLGPTYYGTIGNLWHLLEVEGATQSGHCYGSVRSWAFAPAQGWVPSRPMHHGIDHTTPFGYLTDKGSLLKLCGEKLKEAIAGSQMVTWEDVRTSEPVLHFQPGPIVWGLLDELGPVLGLRAHGERDSLDNLLVVKRVA